MCVFEFLNMRISDERSSMCTCLLELINMFQLEVDQEVGIINFDKYSGVEWYKMHAKRQQMNPIINNEMKSSIQKIKLFKAPESWFRN